MAIIGNSFADYVSNQINIRQKALGEGLNSSNPRTQKTLQAYNTKTPWIRLASAVSIKDGSVSKSVQNLFSGFDWKDDALSKNFVLYGGTSNESGNNRPSGIIKNSPLQGAYGFGYTLDQAQDGRGYTPPPGIINVDFEYKNDGALAFATINVKAFNEVQFNIIDILFQRPGYTCLLEFGHSVYLDNNNVLTYPEFSTPAFEYLYSAPGKGVSYSSMAEKIQTTKRNFNGNYEGFFGRIGKFNWKFNTDGSYDITIKLTGTGDVISSLKVNTPKKKKNNLPVSFKSGNESQPSERQQRKAAKENAYVISEALASQLNFELYSIFEDTTNFPLSGNASSSDIELINIPVNDKSYSKVISKGVFKVDVNDWGFTKYSPLTHIQFQVFLSMLQKICNLKDGSDNYLLNFSMVNNILTQGYDDTYIITFPGNFSGNPNKCLIPYTSFKSNITKVTLNENYIVNKNLGKDPKPITDVPQPELAMRLSHVYVDIGFISQTLKNLKGNDPESDDEVEVKLLDFLKAILEGINSSLGGLNSFRVLFNENTHTIDIISESPILNTKPDPNQNLTELNTFGLTPGEGSFVTEMDLNSELSDQMATQISIGAQANGNTNHANATAFSTYNNGLVDRLMPEKKDADDEDPSDEETLESKDPIFDIFNPKDSDSDDVSEVFYQVYGDREFGDDFINTLENINSTLAKKVIGKYTQIGQSPVPFFLPFNLSLVMDGIGGIKIFEAFKVQGRGLPSSYSPSEMSLIIKSLSHSVSLEGWKTKISTIAKPLVAVTTNSSPTNSSPSDSNDNSGGSSTVTSNSPTTETPVPEGLDPTSETRFNAMQTSFRGVFNNFGSVSGMCAQWSYNLALNYCRALKGLNDTIPGNKLPAGGNANNNNNFWSSLVKMGYTQTKVGNNITRNRVSELLNNTSWGYGDIVVYYANDGNTSDSHVKYGHAQVYVGELNTPKWTTSTQNNYGTNFVYRNRKSNQWDFYVFRAPSNVSEVGTGPGL